MDTGLEVGELKIMKAMEESLIDPGVEDIDYKALHHIIGHGKVVYLRSTRPIYRYPKESIWFQEEGSESSLSGVRRLKRWNLRL